MPPFVQTLLVYLRADHRRAITAIFGACASAVILPFALLRFSEGRWVAGVADIAIATGIALVTRYAWRGGDLVRAGFALLVLNTAGCLLIVTLLGSAGMFWLFPAVMANFLLVRPSRAGAAALVMMVVVQLIPGAFDTPLQRWSVAATLILVAVFAYLFALITAAQRSALEELATHDALTGALNRRALNSEVVIVLSAHRRTSRPVTLMMLDLDHFKRINDRHGHDVGDVVLRDFAALLHSATRSNDRVYRYGGEEFAVLMEHTDARAAARAFANLQRRVHASLAANGDPVTVSAGVAVLRHGEEWEDWFARADAALYRAKQGGRDRIEVDDGTA